MTIERLSELYQKGYYSQIDYYVGVVNLLVGEQEPGRVLERIPAELLGFVAEMAQEHDESAGAAGATEEQRIPQGIVRWRHDQLVGNTGRSGANGNAG